MTAYTYIITTLLFYIIIYTIIMKYSASEAKDYPTSQNTISSQESLTSKLKCLRLYTGQCQTGDWFDMCDSNEVLSSLFIWDIKSACAPSCENSGELTHWLLYEQPHFTGPYILLGPGRCVDNVYQYKMISVSSILTCTQNLKTTPYPTVECHYPEQPWRQLQALTHYYDTDCKDKTQDCISQTKSTSKGKDVAIVPLVKTENLTDLLRESVNNK